MKIISTNIATPKTVIWQGKEVTTGIFKKPVDHPLELEATDVKKDHVIDRKHHGGIHKACYLYASDHYPFWKEKYPDLDWQWGMFGENLTVEGLDEANIFIGEIYKVGTAIVQVSQPRQPCFKLGIRFKDSLVVKEFLQHPYPGVYLRVLTPGTVQVGDTFELDKPTKNKLSIADVYYALFHKPINDTLKSKIISDSHMHEKLRGKMMQRIQDA